MTQHIINRSRSENLESYDMLLTPTNARHQSYHGGGTFEHLDTFGFRMKRNHTANLLERARKGIASMVVVEGDLEKVQLGHLLISIHLARSLKSSGAHVLFTNV